MAGGVGANRELRRRLTQSAADQGMQVFYPAPEFCTDNGAMIAYAAALRLQETGPAIRNAVSGGFSVKPRWNLATLKPAGV